MSYEEPGFFRLFAQTGEGGLPRRARLRGGPPESQAVGSEFRPDSGAMSGGVRSGIRAGGRSPTGLALGGAPAQQCARPFHSRSRRTSPVLGAGPISKPELRGAVAS